jgi:aminopeptidase Y
MLIMLHSVPLIALGALAGASIIQQPIIDSDEALHHSKPLIDSESLQSHLTSDNLLKRARDLYKIAELGIEEYNHPTRVIGSEGMEL